MTSTDRAAWTRAYGGDDQVAPLRANKYHAQCRTVDGIRFDSKHEARRYEYLKLLAVAGEISALEIQPEFVITVVELWRDDGRRVDCGRYRADFRYIDMQTGEVVVEDTKSGPTKTTAYRLRKRLVQAIYGVTIREV